MRSIRQILKPQSVLKAPPVTGVKPPLSFPPRAALTLPAPVHCTAHFGIRAPAPRPIRATPAPQHFHTRRTPHRAFWNPRSRALSNLRSPCAATLPAPAQSRILESALPRPVQLAQPLRRNTSRARAPHHAHWNPRSRAPHVRASPHIHSPPHALAPLPRASRRRIVSNTQLMVQRKERCCAASVFIALCF